jgi:hypothetical protein
MMRFRFLQARDGDFGAEQVRSVSGDLRAEKARPTTETLRQRMRGLTADNHDGDLRADKPQAGAGECGTGFSAFQITLLSRFAALSHCPVLCRCLSLCELHMANRRC